MPVADDLTFWSEHTLSPDGAIVPRQRPVPVELMERLFTNGGAATLGQPSTFLRWVEQHPRLPRDFDVTTPRYRRLIGADHLDRLLTRYDGVVGAPARAAVVAFHSGEAPVDDAIKVAGDRWEDHLFADGARAKTKADLDAVVPPPVQVAAGPRKEPPTFSRPLERERRHPDWLTDETLTLWGRRLGARATERIQDLDRFIDETATKYGIRSALARRMIREESGGDPDAVGQAGEIGLMQLMPETARLLGVKNPRDPKANVEGGLRHFADLLKKFGGNEVHALASYNAGEPAVRASLRLGQLGPKMLTYVRKFQDVLISPASSGATVAPRRTVEPPDTGRRPLRTDVASPYPPLPDVKKGDPDYAVLRELEQRAIKELFPGIPPTKWHQQILGDEVRTAQLDARVRELYWPDRLPKPAGIAPTPPVLPPLERGIAAPDIVPTPTPPRVALGPQPLPEAPEVLPEAAGRTIPDVEVPAPSPMPPRAGAVPAVPPTAAAPPPGITMRGRPIAPDAATALVPPVTRSVIPSASEVRANPLAPAISPRPAQLGEPSGAPVARGTLGTPAPPPPTPALAPTPAPPSTAGRVFHALGPTPAEAGEPTTPQVTDEDWKAAYQADLQRGQAGSERVTDEDWKAAYQADLLREPVIRADVSPPRQEGLLERGLTALGVRRPEDVEARRRQQEAAKAVVEITGGPKPKAPLEEIPGQFLQGFAQGTTAGLSGALAHAYGIETAEPTTTAGGLAKGFGDLAGFLVGVPLRTGKAVIESTVGRWLSPVVTDARQVAMAKMIARESATLAVASASAQTGTAVEQPTAGGALSEFGQAAKEGAIFGAVFGTAKGVLPDEVLWQKASRIGLGLATLDVARGNRPWDDRTVAQKAFDYGLNAYFLFHGQKVEDVVGTVRENAQRWSITEDEAFQRSVAQAAEARVGAQGFARIQRAYERQGLTPEDAKLRAVRAVLGGTELGTKYEQDYRRLVTEFRRQGLTEEEAKSHAIEAMVFGVGGKLGAAPTTPSAGPQAPPATEGAPAPSAGPREGTPPAVSPPSEAGRLRRPRPAKPAPGPTPQPEVLAQPPAGAPPSPVEAPSAPAPPPPTAGPPIAPPGAPAAPSGPLSEAERQFEEGRRRAEEAAAKLEGAAAQKPHEGVSPPQVPGRPPVEPEAAPPLAPPAAGQPIPPPVSAPTAMPVEGAPGYFVTTDPEGRVMWEIRRPDGSLERTSGGRFYGDTAREDAQRAALEHYRTTRQRIDQSLGRPPVEPVTVPPAAPVEEAPPTEVAPIGRPKTTGRYAVEVTVGGDKWSRNALRFDTPAEAEAYASDLASRWIDVRDWRVVDTQGGAPTPVVPEAPPPSLPAIPGAYEHARRLGQITGLFERQIREQNQLPTDPRALRAMVAQELGIQPSAFTADPALMDDLQDAIETAINKVYRERRPDADLRQQLARAEATERWLGSRIRTLELTQRQQFSTPLTVAEAGAHALDLRRGDTVLEPTAGTGNLLAPLPLGTPIIANELDPRRAEALRLQGYEPSVLDYLRSTAQAGRADVAFLNPPWGKHSTQKYGQPIPMPYGTPIDVAERFFVKALGDVRPGGRVVAIMPTTILKAPKFLDWLKQAHTLRALVENPPHAYDTRGTTVGSVVLVVDKGRVPNAPEPIRGAAADWDEFARLLAPLSGGGTHARVGGAERPEGAVPEPAREPAGGPAGGPVEPAPRPSVQPPVPGPAEPSPPVAPAGGGARRPIEAGVPGVAGGPPAGGGEPRPSVVPVGVGGGGVEPGGAPSAVSERSDSPPRAAEPHFVEGVAAERYSVADPAELDAARRSRVFIPAPLRRSPGVNPHPRLIVRTRSLAGAKLPELTSEPKGAMIADAYRRKVISDQQLDYGILPSLQADERGHGYMFAADVGVGKTRVAAAVIGEWLETGKYKRVLYVTNSEVNVQDAIGEFNLYAGKPYPFDIIPVRSFPGAKERQGKGPEDRESLPTPERAIYMIDHYNLASFEAALKDLDLDAVVGDEAHLLKNIDDAKVGQAWNRLQLGVLAKRGGFLYLSATPATDFDDLKQFIGLREWVPGGFEDYVARVTGASPEAQGDIGALRSRLESLTAQWQRLPDVSEDEKTRLLDALPDTESWGPDLVDRLRDAIDRVENALVDKAQATTAAIGSDADDIRANRPGKRRFNGRDVFSAHVTPAEQEQVMRELAMKNKYDSIDLWRAGVDFEIATNPLTAEQTAEYARLSAFMRDLNRDFLQWGRLNKSTGRLLTIRHFLQQEAKRRMFDYRLDHAIRLAKESLARGEQPVISLINVNEGTEKSGPIPAAINSINVRQVETDPDTGEITLDEEIPEAIQRRAELLDQWATFRQVPNPVDRIVGALGKDKVAVIIGKTSPAMREKQIREFQSGERTVAVISGAGKVGISLHHVVDTPGATKGRRHMIVADYEWSAEKFKQELGRVDRSGQRSAPRITPLSTGQAGEKKFLATIANRMRNLGALSKGSAESASNDKLAEFELGGGLDTHAMRLAYRALDPDIQQKFLANAFRDPQNREQNTSSYPQNASLKDFLLDIQFMEPEDGNAAFEKFWSERERLIAEHEETAERRAGRTRSYQGDIVRSVNLRPDLTLHEVRDEHGQHYGLLQGIVTPHLVRIARFLEESERSGLPIRKYITFQAGDRQLAGLEIRAGSMAPLMESFGKSAVRQLDTPEQVIEALRAGDKVPLEGVAGYILRMRPSDKRLQVQGAKMADKDSLLRAGAAYAPVGNFWFVPEDRLAQFLERYPVKPPAAPDVSFMAVEPEGEALAPPFFSGLQRAIEERMPASASVEQVRAILRGPGVKEDEVKWTGLDDFLAGKTKVSRQDILDFLQQHEVRIEEVGRPSKGWSEPDPARALGTVEWSEPVQESLNLTTRGAGRGMFTVWYGTGSSPQGRVTRATITAIPGRGYVLDAANTQNAAFDTLEDAKRGAEEGSVRVTTPTKFAQYQLPGAEPGTYRELLLTLPERAREVMQYPEPLTVLPEGYDLITDSNQPPDRRWGVTPPEQIHGRPWAGRHPTREAAIEAALRQLNEQRNEQYADEWRRRNEGRTYKSPHFDEPNILAHVRFNDRTDAQGKRVLFLEEVQSDWHAEGRRKGYRGRRPVLTLPPTVELYEFDNSAGHWFQYVWTPESGRAGAVASQGRTEAEARNLALDELSRDEGVVPPAPFAKTWHELVLKRMLRWGVEHGYDKLAWTTGEIQADRYDLSKQVSKITSSREFYGDQRPLERRYRVEAFDTVGRSIFDRRVPETELPNLVGKDLAEKIAASPDGAWDWTGLDLKVGGEGMKGFYDQILPAFLSKYGKKWGTQVGTTEIVTEPTTAREAIAIGTGAQSATVHAIDITPAMKESVLHEGQPLFMAGRSDLPGTDAVLSGLHKAPPIPGAPGLHLADTTDFYFSPDRLRAIAQGPHVAPMARGAAQAYRRLRDRLALDNARYAESVFFGLSLDHRYYGVNVKPGPGHASVLLNLHATARLIEEYLADGIIAPDEAPAEMARHLVDILLHEATHQEVRGHGDPFSVVYVRNATATEALRNELALDLERILREGDAYAAFRDEAIQFAAERAGARRAEPARPDLAGAPGSVGGAGGPPTGPAAGARPGEALPGGGEGATAGMATGPELERGGPEPLRVVETPPRDLEREGWRRMPGIGVVALERAEAMVEPRRGPGLEFTVQRVSPLLGVVWERPVAEAAPPTPPPVAAGGGGAPPPSPPGPPAPPGGGEPPEGPEGPEGLGEPGPDPASEDPGPEPEGAPERPQIHTEGDRRTFFAEEAQRIAEQIRARGDEPTVRPAPSGRGQQMVTWRPGRFDVVRRWLAPASRGPVAQLTAAQLRAMEARLVREDEQARWALRKAAHDLDRLASDEQRIAFIDYIEHGRIADLPEWFEGTNLRPVAQALREMFDRDREDVQALGTGALSHWLEDYFPHIWTRPDDVIGALGRYYGKRPLEGPKSFLKRRTIPTTVDGMAAGLTPVSMNPITLALLKHREMRKYIHGQQFFQDMKERKIARFVRESQVADARRQGLAEIDDRIARVRQYSPEEHGFIERGKWMMPEEGARVLNNYLRPGFYGRNALFDAYRGFGNLLNMVQLGFSAFHVGFVTLDTQISAVALGLQETGLGLEQLAKGDIARAGENLATGGLRILLSPTAPVRALFSTGPRARREYYESGSEGALVQRLVDAWVEGGGRARMDRWYSTDALAQFGEAWRQKNAVDMARWGLPAFIESFSWPIFEYIVPRMKAGVAMDMLRFEMENMPADATTDELRAVWGAITDSVDDRLGQLTYTNLFWDRRMKDGLMATVRTVGWNLGTYRTGLGGAVVDLPKMLGYEAAAVHRALSGVAPEIREGARRQYVNDIRSASPLPRRLAYLIALPIVNAIWSALYQWWMTGAPPDQPFDFVAPRTGRRRPDGSADRKFLPTYMKDAVAYSADLVLGHPLRTLLAKIHPELQLLADEFSNKDFMGGPIRNARDPVIERLADSLDYAITYFEPYGAAAYQRALREGATPAEAAQGFVGVTPAPSYATRPWEQSRAREAKRETIPPAWYRKKRLETQPRPVRRFVEREEAAFRRLQELAQ